MPPYFSDTIGNGIQRKKTETQGSAKEKNTLFISINADKQSNGGKQGGGAERQKTIEHDIKRNDRTINLNERGANYANYKNEREKGTTRSDDLI